MRNDLIYKSKIIKELKDEKKGIELISQRQGRDLQKVEKGGPGIEHTVIHDNCTIPPL